MNRAQALASQVPAQNGRGQIIIGVVKPSVNGFTIMANGACAKVFIIQLRTGAEFEHSLRAFISYMIRLNTNVSSQYYYSAKMTN